MFSGLRFRMNLLILLAMLPAVALTVYVNLEQRYMAVSEVKNDLQETLRHVVAEEKHQTQATLQILVALSYHPHLNGREPDRCSETFQRLLPQYPQYGNFAVFNSDGAFACSAVPFSQPDGGVSNATITRAIKSYRFTIGDCRIDPRTGRSTVWYGYPVVDEAVQAGRVIFAERKLDWFPELAAMDRLKDQLTLTLLDPGGGVMAFYPTPLSGFNNTVSNAEFMRTISAPAKDMLEEIDSDGTRKLRALLPLEGAPSRGYVLSEVPLEAIYIHANRQLMRNLIILALVTLAALAVAGLFGQTLIVRKMNMLLMAARKLSSGDYSARSGLSHFKCEFGQLGQAFDEMAAAIEWHEAGRNATEEALKKSEAGFRNLVESSLTGICIIQDTQVIFLNPEHERLSGLPFQQPRFIDFSLIHPEDVDKVKSVIDDLTSGRVQTGEVTFRFFQSPESAGIEAERPRWVHSRARRMVYQDKPSILANMMDITEMKELESIVSMQDKMASLGRVTAGIVHELRNPLSALDIQLVNLERLLEKIEHPAPELLKKAADNVVHLKSAVHRIGAVIEKVTDFAKPGRRKFVPTDINNCIETAIQYCKTSLIKSGISVGRSLAGDLPACLADPFAIEQVLVNLIENAISVMQGPGKLCKLEIATLAGDGFVVAKVCDAGPGVPLHLRDKIFDPFYSTRKNSMGIGLSICQRIVSDHGGSLKVADSKWGGAEFSIRIPYND